MQPYVIESTMQNVKSCLQRNPPQNSSLFQWHQDFSHTSLKHLTPSAKLGQQSAAAHILGQEILRETELGRLICCPHDTHNSDYLWPLTWKTLGYSNKCSPMVIPLNLQCSHFPCWQHISGMYRFRELEQTFFSGLSLFSLCHGN